LADISRWDAGMGADQTRLATLPRAWTAVGDVLGDRIVCPRHGTRSGLDDGSLRHGPGAYPQPSLQVRVRGGRVEFRAPRT
jgi:nitrite reductase/ring-hydroxylating ferredoxin subunit